METFAVVGCSPFWTRMLAEGLTALGLTPVDPLASPGALVVGSHPADTALESGLFRQENTRLLLLSSAEVYGESAHHCGDCGSMPQARRDSRQFSAHRWEVLCPICDEMLMPAPLTEETLLRPITLQGERLVAWESEIQAFAPENPCAVFRLFLPYWPVLEWLSEPDAGMLGRFAQQLLAGEAPLIQEDGCQMRDWTHGADVVQVLARAIRVEHPVQGVFNIGSGTRLSVQEATAYLQEFLDRPEVPYTVSETHRPGDVRHRFADISRARQVLGYTPQFPIITGLANFAQHLS